jgi:hypothetical protein
LGGSEEQTAYDWLIPEVKLVSGILAPQIFQPLDINPYAKQINVWEFTTLKLLWKHINETDK